MEPEPLAQNLRRYADYDVGPERQARFTDDLRDAADQLDDLDFLYRDLPELAQVVEAWRTLTRSARRDLR